jgi:hypothetical protein
MTENDTPDLSDVLATHEQATPDHREHAKTPKHLNDEELAHRTEQERIDVGIEEFDPDDVPPAEE